MNPKVKSISSYKDSKREFSQNHLVLKEPITFLTKKEAFYTFKKLEKEWKGSVDVKGSSWDHRCPLGTFIFKSGEIK